MAKSTGTRREDNPKEGRLDDDDEVLLLLLRRLLEAAVAIPMVLALLR